MRAIMASLVLGLVLATGVHAADAVPNAVYKWTDVKGVIHYSDRPALSAEKARDERAIGKNDLAAGENPLAQKALANDLRGIAEQRRVASEAEQRAREQGLSNESRAKACLSAQEAMRVYASGGRISTVNESGEKAFLSDAEIQAKQAQASKAVEDACSPLKAAAAPPPVVQAPAAAALSK